jgi:DNA-binding NarL/FixJ family response regulator
VAAGEGYLSQEVTAAVMQAAAQSRNHGGEDLLSSREMDVLDALAEGLTNREIANRLVISRNTVKTHVQNILKKLDAANRTEAVAHAAKLGLI